MKRNNDNIINVNNISVGVDAHGDPCKKHRFNTSNAGISRVSARGITLIALVITIIILLILAGVALTLTIGENGIINHAKTSKETYSEAQAREKLELTLLDLQADKLIKTEYNETAYINERLTSKGFAVNGDIVLVDGWQFEIDRSVPRIATNLGRGEIETNIVVNVSSQTREDYVNATLTIEIAYENEITEIILNGDSLDVPEKNANGKYVITINNITVNGLYSVVAKDGDKINIGSTIVSDITEDIEIRNANELVAFRDRVNNGATFEGRTVTVASDIDLAAICHRVDGTTANDISWTPIGTNEKRFKGTFHGNDHTINNLYINTTNRCQGLFGIVEGADIKNIKLANSNITGGIMIGGIAGYVKDSTIENSMVDSTTTITGLSKNQYGSYVGGIVGSCEGVDNHSIIKKCINKGTVYGKYDMVGGIVGVLNGDIEECVNAGTAKSDNNKVGGLVGFAQTAHYIKNSYSVGEITAKADAGGIIGVVESRVGFRKFIFDKTDRGRRKRKWYCWKMEWKFNSKKMLWCRRHYV